MVLMQMNRREGNMELLERTFEGYPGEVRLNEPIAPYTSMKVGGPAEVMVFPKSLSDVIDLMERLNRYHLPSFILGGGSNLLVKDGGVAGVVIHLKHLNQMEVSGADILTAQGGASYPKLSLFAAEKGLSGLEFAVGIPGTVGGAVVMNAGIPGEETATVLKEITLVNEIGRVLRVPKEQIPFGYRSAGLPKGVVISASFALLPASVDSVNEKMKGLLQRRRETQPLSFPNVGSVFKNPKGRFAGQLIEAAGLKGVRAGDAQISERHGNFIINRGSATAKEVLALIEKIRQKVEAEHGIALELEAKVVGREA
jgi:UDP-N-acetylmuramate dehydrogenase